MPNKLAAESSPYLLQHADNPVDWFPWGPEALELARETDKPILLSIGYSACHWCHVMAHESFENEEIAALMNERFVNIKVDREERPDLDALYMLSVQMMTGHGGWPMTVFLTPDGKPFYGGTYYPPADRGPMPGFPRILQGVSEAYRDRQHQVVESAEKLTENLNHHFTADLQATQLNSSLLDKAYGNLIQQFDRTNGGFGGAPKFPAAMTIEFLLDYFTRTGNDEVAGMIHLTLDRMARGGLYDQVGGGFHRYTVDAIWLVPHFEKMLYDNALLADVYTQAYQLTGEPFFRTIAEETLDFILNELTSEDGGFYSTLDADTEGEEGKYYTWTLAELRDALGEHDSQSVAELMGVSERGNFEGTNVLAIQREPDRLLWRNERFTTLREQMLSARNEREYPGRDEKILTSWNGLALRAFANAAWVFESSRYAEVAVQNATFLRQRLLVDGQLQHAYKDGQAKIDGFLEDYAFVLDGLLALYQATFQPEWLTWANQLAETAIGEFYDQSTGAFYDTGSSSEQLVARPRDAYDNATPSGNSVIADVLVRLSHLTGNVSYARLATDVFEDYGFIASEQPQGFSRLLSGLSFAVGPSAEIAIAGPVDASETSALVNTVRIRYLPRSVRAVGDPADKPGELVELLAGRELVDGLPAGYVCVNFACQLPVTDPQELNQQLDSVFGNNDRR